MKKEFNELSCENQEADFARAREEKQALFSTCPPRGAVQDSHELPLSNKLISVRDNRRIGSKDTEGELHVYPSSLVRKRVRSDLEQDYYDLIARYGKKSRVGGSIRGEINHFSNASRFRLLKKLHQVGRQDPPFMTTLTYRSGSVTFEQSKKDLRKFRFRLDRLFGEKQETIENTTNKHGLPTQRKRIKYKPQWTGIWRYEMTTGRGTRAKSATPHFHVLIWADQWHTMEPNELERCVSEIWCQVTGDGGEDRMKYGCRIDLSHGDQTKIKNYMLGHHAKKTDQEATFAGRHWGIMNEELLDMGKPVNSYHMTCTQRNRYDRITAKLIASRTKAKKVSNNADLLETHLVLSPYEMKRLMKHLGVSEISELGGN